MARISWMIIGAVLITACGAAAQFNYHYFGVDAANYDGYLRGPKPENDLPFSTCKPTPGKAAPCLAMIKDQFLALKADYLDLQNKLNACQRGTQ